MSHSLREFTLFDVLLILKTNSLRLLLVTVAAGALALGGTFLITPLFTGEVRFLPPAQQSGGGLASLLGNSQSAFSGVASSLGVGKTNGDLWLGMAKSRTVQDALVKRFGLLKRYRQQYLFRTRQELESRTNVTLGKDGIITLTVVDADPQTAAHLADAYVEELQKLNDSMAVTDAAQRRAFFESQLNSANEALIKAETALNSGGINESLLKASPEAAVDVVGQLKAQEMAAQIRLEVLHSRVTESSPEYLQARQELLGLRAQLAAANGSVHTGKPASSASAPRGSGDDYVRRYRNFKYAETLFEMIARQYELARLDEAQQGSMIQVIDRAAVPEWKSSPKRGMLTVIVALLVFLVAATRLLVLAALNEAKVTRPALNETLESIRAVRWFR